MIHVKGSFYINTSSADLLPTVWKKKDTCQVVGMYKKNRSWGETPPGHILEERYQAWNADRHRGFSDPQTPGFSALTKKLVGMYFCPFSSISLSKSFFSFLCLFDFLWFVVYWFRYHMCRSREDLQSIPLVPCSTTTFSLYYLYLLGFSLWIIFSWAQQQMNPVTHW